MANSVDPDQTAPIGAVCSGSTLFASILNLSVMLGNYLQQMTSADDIFRCIFFLGALRVKRPILIHERNLSSMTTGWSPQQGRKVAGHAIQGMLGREKLLQMLMYW